MELPGPLKGMLGGPRGAPPANGPGHPAGVPSGPGRPLDSSWRQGSGVANPVRPSRGLEEFFSYIRGQSGLTILDLGGASQQNVSFITGLGHRLYSEDFLRILGDTFGEDGAADQSNPGRIDYFLRQTLDHPRDHFDGVLIWDVLEYLAPALLNAVVERLHKTVRPKSYMLAFFHSDDKLEAVPSYTFRIQQMNMIEVVQHGMRRPAQLFNNRSLEKLFGRFESVKFFLTRERLREVIIKA
jgi:2-polyprenyl-3-methyl-5-hydroxy-6-metoxy-1,4-benzoquinol methylase